MNRKIKIIGKTLQGDDIILALQDEEKNNLVHSLVVPAKQDKDFELGAVLTLSLSAKVE